MPAQGPGHNPEYPSAHGAGYAGPSQGAGPDEPAWPTPLPAPARPSARPRQSSRKVPIVVGVLAVVLVLCIGGGAAAYYFVFADGSSSEGDRRAEVGSPTDIGSASNTPAAAAPTVSASPTKAGGEETVSGDLSGYRKGDCLTVDESQGNRVEKAKCTDAGAYQVLLRKDGTLDDSVCASTKAEFTLSQDASGTARDFILCVGPVS